MSKTDLTAQHFTDKTAAREYLEKLRWPNGPVCPKCGSTKMPYALSETDKVREGVYKCADCREQFTVTVGTVFERSRVPLNKWLLAVHLLCSSKKGISTHQIHRTIGVTYKTAWFMTHRIREAMKDSFFVKPMDGKGRVVEANETYWGNKGKERKGARGFAHKEKIFSLVERGGRVRSLHVPTVAAKTLRPIMTEQIDKETAIVPDEMGAYKHVADEFASHEVVRYSAGKYVRGAIYTNTIENYFSILKPGLTGVYQHVGANHLKRYIGEFDFRYNNREVSDVERMRLALAGIAAKRLMYRDS